MCACFQCIGSGEKRDTCEVLHVLIHIMCSDMGFFDNLRRKTGSRMTMNVCMMGPRAVGKTTVLTAIFSETQNTVASTRIAMHPLGDTRIDLIEKQQMLAHIFASRTVIEDRPEAGIEASGDVHVFDFTLGLIGKEPKIDLHIKDFPGEYVKSRPDEVISFIEESNAVFIAVDTPHLMEEGGKYCEAKNRTGDITSFFRKCISRVDSDKLVLIIPLKCEKYFFTGQMDAVLRRIEAAYSDLISLFKDSGKIACAVAPILTLGGVEFDRFRSTGGVVDVNPDGCPSDVVYRFRDADASYSPAFCVQPLYYLLSFTAELYKRNKETKSFFNRMISKLFDLFDNDPELFEEIIKIERYRGIDIPGYKVECGEDKFHYNR